ncbi:MAG: hypothetical protein DRJ31_08855 [Candidatus Methanomethylicota archaeon]|uniref:Uncharacterized protein n=1 Tax=Thermoproteota archaeon TaxID=2056631 RepID=A0A497ELR8_9CREN|nr:MAG: hypothetical protein DRJ31_08855 [Candidatus Verstraetearchaeota archaeon]
MNNYEDTCKQAIEDELNGKYDSSARRELKRYEVLFETCEALKDKIERGDDLYSIHQAVDRYPQGVENLLELAEFLEEEITPQNIETLAFGVNNGKVASELKEFLKKSGRKINLLAPVDVEYLPEFLKKIEKGEIEIEKIIAYPPSRTGIYTTFPIPTHYGRGRGTRFTDLFYLIRYGRADRPLYEGWEYVDSLSSDDQQKNEKLEKIKNYKALRKELKTLSEKLKKWKKEGENLLNHLNRTSRGVYAGFCVKYDGDVDVEEALKHRVSTDAGELKFLINRGFKAPSWFGKMVEEMVNELYEISEDAEKNPGVAYALNHWDELSDMERESFAERYESVRKMKELEQIKNAIEKYAKGVYFADPPMHSGNGGEDVDERNPRSYSMVERVFHRCDGYYVNVNEYFILRQDDEMRIRIYDFKRKPSRAEPSDGIAVEIETDGEKRFLKENEIERLKSELEKYTLPTLYLKKFV